MPIDYLGQGPDDMDNERLADFVDDQRDVVQAEFGRLSSEGDHGRYEASLDTLRRFPKAAQARGLDVPPSP